MFLFNISCASFPEYSEYSPLLEKKELKNIGIQTDKPIEIFLAEEREGSLPTINDLLDNENIQDNFKNTFLQTIFVKWFSSDAILKRKYYLQFKKRKIISANYESLIVFVVTMGLFPFKKNISHTCELSGFVNQEEINYRIEIEENRYVSFLLLFYLPSWEQTFNQPNVSEYCVYSLLEKYRNERNKN